MEWLVVELEEMMVQEEVIDMVVDIKGQHLEHPDDSMECATEPTKEVGGEKNALKTNNTEMNITLPETDLGFGKYDSSLGVVSVCVSCQCNARGNAMATVIL